ncbi:hypothetical protein D9611_009276 [Ephemerocybe angulata]|uniref:Uncharacterized protein n=1 Tax=Ephemerocybe angulata TaxID=980116 RepID=A0A8H5BGU8_9AGAR|nr:hypothetical protein D9611_009276 [Tulosesus angulatus]
MSYNSPFKNADSHVTRVANLTNEAITIDKGVAQATRDAAEFASKYSSDFRLVEDLKTSTQQFSDRWVGALQQTRDAASSISAWYQRFDQVFLALINDIGSQGDAEDVVSEFNSLKNEAYPTSKYHLDDAPGAKSAFNAIEQLVSTESDHVIQVLQGGGNWKDNVAKLNQPLPAVQNGVRQIRGALNTYATKLE